MKKIIILFTTFLLLGVSSFANAYEAYMQAYDISVPEGWERIPYYPSIEDINLESKYSSDEVSRNYEDGYSKTVQNRGRSRLLPSHKISSPHILIRHINIKDIYLEDIYNEIYRNKENIFGLEILSKSSLQIKRESGVILVHGYGFDQPKISAIFPSKDFVTQIDFFTENSFFEEDKIDFYKIVESFSYDYNYRYNKPEKSLFDIYSYLPLIQIVLLVTLILMIIWRIFNYLKSKRCIKKDKIQTKKTKEKNREIPILKEKERNNDSNKKIYWTMLGVYLIIYLFKILDFDLSFGLLSAVSGLVGSLFIYFALPFTISIIISNVISFIKKDGKQQKRFYEIAIIVIVLFSFLMFFAD